MYIKTASGEVYETDSPQYFKDSTKITRKEYEAARRAQAIKQLRKMFRPGSTVQTVLRHVSRSGMYRRISVMVCAKGQVRDVSCLVADAIGAKKDNYAIGVGGCGMDMGFHIAHSLGRALYRNGFKCPGEHCPCSDHFNDPTNKREKGKLHKGDGGYSLRHAWI